MKNPKHATRKLLELTNEFSKIAGYKINKQKGIAFLSSVQLLSCVRLFVTPWTEAPQASLCITIPEYTKTHVHCVSDAYLTISSSVTPFSSCLHSFPASGSFPVSRLFASGGQSIGASASASVLPMSIQGWFPLGWLVWSPCCPRDSQESSPGPQFEGINLEVLSFLYSPVLTYIHGHGKKHSFD